MNDFDYERIENMKDRITEVLMTDKHEYGLTAMIHLVSAYHVIMHMDIESLCENMKDNFHFLKKAMEKKNDI